MRIKAVFLCGLFLLQIGITNAQFQNKRKDIGMYKDILQKERNFNARTAGLTRVDITQYLPKNFVKDGSIDYTAYIQKAFDEQRVILMPDFPLLTTGIWVRSNTQVWFQTKSRLVMKSTADTHYMVLALIGVENVSLYDADIEGDFSRHLGEAGQWGYGVDIRGSRNIKIINLHVQNCWGDGIVISSNPNKFTNGVSLFDTKNVLIDNAIVDYNRRNGITIAGGENIVIRNSLISNTFGTQPKAAIDIEPDNGKPKLERISLTNLKFFNNASGLNFYLNSYANKNTNNRLDLTIKNLEFRDHIYALVIYGFDEKPNNKLPLSGHVSIENVELEGVTTPIHKGKPDYNILPRFSVKGWKAEGVLLNHDALLKGVKSKGSLELR